MKRGTGGGGKDTTTGFSLASSARRSAALLSVLFLHIASWHMAQWGSNSQSGCPALRVRSFLELTNLFKRGASREIALIDPRRAHLVAFRMKEILNVTEPPDDAQLVVAQRLTPVNVRQARVALAPTSKLTRRSGVLSYNCSSRTFLFACHTVCAGVSDHNS